ncbi:heterokaryon incompatibility protein-domain-containing protein [Tricladium varicosporioides]|nr:heterokaryon incompatibility protein-domain-containing protein [Hymenoscyphus varicosporioides]
MASPVPPDATNAFSYTPLANPNSQIRLLMIPLDVNLYLGGSSHGPLMGKLATYDIPVGTLSRAKRFFLASRLPLFYALSYVWGDQTKCHEIWIDGKWLAITRNLYLALRSMQSGITGKIYIWADAICMNQEDNSEKSAQIQLMRDIYHSASEVRIWLGEGTPETKRCLHFVIDLTGAPNAVCDEPTESILNEVEEALVRALVSPVTAFGRGGIRFGQGVVDFEEIFAPPSARDDDAKLINPDEELSLNQSSIHTLTEWRPSNSKLKAVEEREGDFIEVAKLIDKFFIQQPWFTRMWVVQEYCCARSCQMQIGRTTLDWEFFVRAIHYLHFHREIHFDNIRKVVGLEIIRLGWTERKRQSLKDLIRETRYREATDPKDKIYSLYGLMGDHTNEYLKPNYSLSVAEVYSNTSRHFIMQSKSLDCLLGWQNGLPPYANRVLDLPSWVPDYSLPQTRTPSPLVPIDGRESIYAASGYDHRAEYRLPTPSESLTFPHGISGFTDWSILRARGIAIDNIISISTPLVAANLPLEAESNFGLAEKSWLSALLESVPLQQQLTHEIRALLSYISDIISFYSSIHSQQHGYHPQGKFLAVSSGNSVTPLLPLKQKLSLDTSEYLPILLDHLDQAEENSLPIAYLQALLSGRMSSRERTTTDALRRFITSPYTSSTLQAETPQMLDEIAFLQKSAQALASSLLYRRLAITQKGYLAVVPASTQIGDVTAALFGASVVCILRRRESAPDSCHSSFHDEEKTPEKQLMSIEIGCGEEKGKLAEDMKGEEYTLVGEAYLHGYMDAEAIAMCVRGQFHESNFILC